MTRYVWRNDRFEDRATGEPMDAPERICRPMVVKDVEYMSPLSLKPVTSRSQRREEMKVHNVREVDPSEWRPTYRSRKRAERSWREGGSGEHNPRPKADLGEGYHRLSRDELPESIKRTLGRANT